ncbi:MAG: hypothetical protein ACFE8N_12800, partial [Promethearchaeota archaeon]
TSLYGKIKNEKKQLFIKLKSSGREYRKISLKLESSNADINSGNYNLLSELLKEFFSVDGNSS